MRRLLVELVNLTACDVALKSDDGYTEYPGQGNEDRAFVEVRLGEMLKTDYGVSIREKPAYVVHNLPDPQETRHGVRILYIVDRRVAEACPERTDLVCLGARCPDYYAHAVGRYYDLYTP